MYNLGAGTLTARVSERGHYYRYRALEHDRSRFNQNSETTLWSDTIAALVQPPLSYVPTPRLKNIEVTSVTCLLFLYL